jgi:hypothetical protein
MLYRTKKNQEGMFLDIFIAPLGKILRSGCPNEFPIEHQPMYQVQALHVSYSFCMTRNRDVSVVPKARVQIKGCQE